MTTPRALLLDVMSTLVRDPFWDLPDFFGTDLRTLLSGRDPEDWPRFERNEMDAQTYFDRTFGSTGRTLRELESMFLEGYAWLPGIEALLTDLRDAGVVMHALSNYPVWYRMIEQKLALSQYLPWTFVSYSTGVRKPHPEAYLGPARALGLAPEECLFVDDRGSNCKAATRVGMPAIKFTGAEDLRTSLRALGVAGA